MNYFEWSTFRQQKRSSESLTNNKWSDDVHWNLFTFFISTFIFLRFFCSIGQSLSLECPRMLGSKIEKKKTIKCPFFCLWIMLWIVVTKDSMIHAGMYVACVALTTFIVIYIRISDNRTYFKYSRVDRHKASAVTWPTERRFRKNYVAGVDVAVDIN